MNLFSLKFGYNVAAIWFLDYLLYALKEKCVYECVAISPSEFLLSLLFHVSYLVHEYFRASPLDSIHDHGKLYELMLCCWPIDKVSGLCLFDFFFIISMNFRCIMAWLNWVLKSLTKILGKMICSQKVILFFSPLSTSIRHSQNLLLSDCNFDLLNISLTLLIFFSFSASIPNKLMSLYIWQQLLLFLSWSKSLLLRYWRLTLSCVNSVLYI